MAIGVNLPEAARQASKADKAWKVSVLQHNEHSEPEDERETSSRMCSESTFLMMFTVSEIMLVVLEETEKNGIRHPVCDVSFASCSSFKLSLPNSGFTPKGLDWGSTYSRPPSLGSVNRLYKSILNPLFQLEPSYPSALLPKIVNTYAVLHSCVPNLVRSCDDFVLSGVYRQV